MPLTKTGRKLKRRFRQQYGKQKGERVFYALANSRKSGGKDKISGKKIHKGRRRR